VIKEYDNSTLTMLDSLRRGKVGGFRNEGEKLRSITAGLCLRHAFIEEGHSVDDWENVSIKCGEYGKPYIDGCEMFKYSLSHSGDYVICATDSDEIGADIQEMRQWNMNVAKRFFHESEYNRIIDSPDIDQIKEFYMIWTAKESVLKLNGRGLGAGMGHFVTDGFYNTIRDINDGKSYNIRIYGEIGGYIICVCSRGGDFPDSLKVIDL
jgi:4'-phosphopantetheinyl transferase